jgi:lipoyl(octanoyl) transferase
MNDIQVYKLGLTSYQTAWDLQKQWQQKLIADPNHADVLMILEHPPVYTLGTGSSLEFVKFDADAGYELHRSERGGEVTYHCPGQLVVYPILNLRRHQMDLHWYLRQLEEVVIRLLESYGLYGERISGLTGVWLNEKKVAAIGIKVSRWVTMHGLALNVNNDLSGFEQIVPCGIRDRSVGNLQEFLPTVTMVEVQAKIIKVFGEVFQISYSESLFTESLDTAIPSNMDVSQL